MARRSPLGGVKQKTRRHTHLVTGKAACGRAGPGGAMQPLQRVEAKEEGDERTGGHRVAQEVGREREDGGGSGRVVLRSQPSGGFRWVRPRVLSPNASYIILTCGLRTTNDHRTRHLKRSSPKHGLPFSPTNFCCSATKRRADKGTDLLFPSVGPCDRMHRVSCCPIVAGICFRGKERCATGVLLVSKPATPVRERGNA